MFEPKIFPGTADGANIGGLDDTSNNRGGGSGNHYVNCNVM